MFWQCTLFVRIARSIWEKVAILAKRPQICDNKVTFANLYENRNWVLWEVIQ